ncbi:MULTISPECIES: hypothetical protein [Streptomyces]|uniref:Uncharacterized protein n=1 Tax=Streptomyces venezuelae (strain ATCC 10712 / CBS 650.69 / DSM 40230 / JCM 4526 / NBRC 13096 / PD 04745) TaxID=953739 RepID=F2R4X1_STRVP|nr:hypothetical protein [Streptomyces venezuelae]APE21893.1 hypothetical protein vnz_13270 [Streptomyces venezuelae]CCA55992.1 hypothetical protein SVEN_2706 [Streptomyces venezuelae ATCC 10712]
MQAYMGGGMRTQAVRYSADSIDKFRTGVEGLIEELVGSEAAPGKLKADKVTRAQFGGGGAAWAEAQGAYTAYNEVLGKLVELSGLLNDCLEGLGIAVVASKDGIEQMDDDIKYKMIEIHQRTKDAKRQADIEAGRTAPANGAGQTAEGDASLK